MILLKMASRRWLLYLCESKRRMGMWEIVHIRNIAAVICVLILLSGAVAQPSNNTYNKNPKLESVLSQLINSDDPQEFARAHNLYLRDGKIRVAVELGDEMALLPDYVIIESRYGKYVQTMVPIEKIVALSLEKNVTFIRTPSKPYVDNPTPETQKPVPKSGYNLTIPLIISIVLIFLIRKKGSSSLVKK